MPKKSIQERVDELKLHALEVHDLNQKLTKVKRVIEYVNKSDQSHVSITVPDEERNTYDDEYHRYVDVSKSGLLDLLYNTYNDLKKQIEGLLGEFE